MHGHVDTTTSNTKNNEGNNAKHSHGVREPNTPKPKSSRARRRQEGQLEQKHHNTKPLDPLMPLIVDRGLCAMITALDERQDLGGLKPETWRQLVIRVEEAKPIADGWEQNSRALLTKYTSEVWDSRYLQQRSKAAKKSIHTPTPTSLILELAIRLNRAGKFDIEKAIPDAPEQPQSTPVANNNVSLSVNTSPVPAPIHSFMQRNNSVTSLLRHSPPWMWQWTMSYRVRSLVVGLTGKRIGQVSHHQCTSQDSWLVQRQMTYQGDFEWPSIALEALLGQGLDGNHSDRPTLQEMEMLWPQPNLELLGPTWTTTTTTGTSYYAPSSEESSSDEEISPQENLTMVLEDLCSGCM
ncbi:hypothetical protein Pelo_18351 [Pelomyxa schiedti]|nr:hypothetical protein Pelo_18351 [Pelomyxa schiedti]